MNLEQQRQMDAHKARRARMGAPVTPQTPKIERPRKKLKAALAERLPEPPRPLIYVQFDPAPISRSGQILDEVCYKHGITLWQLKSKVRFHELVQARWEAAYRIYTECPVLSLPQIGKKLCRDHTTILYGVRQYCRMHGLPMPRRLKEIAA